MLRWHFQQGRSPIPKSVHPERVAENFDIFAFERSAVELAQIDALDTVRGGPGPDSVVETRRYEALVSGARPN